MSSVAFESVGNGAVAVDVEKLREMPRCFRLIEEQIGTIEMYGSRNDREELLRVLDTLAPIHEVWSICMRRLIEWQQRETRIVAISEVTGFIYQLLQPLKDNPCQTTKLIRDEVKKKGPFFPDREGNVTVPIFAFPVKRSFRFGGEKVKLSGSPIEFESFHRRWNKLDLLPAVKQIVQTTFFEKKLAPLGTDLTVSQALQCLNDFVAPFEGQIGKQIELFFDQF